MKEAAGFVEFGATITQAAVEAWPRSALAAAADCRGASRTSGISRPATAEPSAARFVMPIRARNCRCALRRWAARWCCGRAARSACSRPMSSRLGMLYDREAAGRDDGRCALSGRRASGWGYAFREISRRHGDFAIVALAADGRRRQDPARRRRRGRQADGARMGRSRRSRTCRTRSTISPGISAAATTSTPPRGIGARWSGGSARR